MNQHENEVKIEEGTVLESQREEEDRSIENAPKPILPDEEYVSETAQEDQEKLDEARRKLMALIRIKGKGISSVTMKAEIEPMVFSMNTKDCDNMYAAIKRHGMAGMTRQVMRYSRSQKKSR